MRCMTRVHIIRGATDTEINDWLASQSNIKIIDIKFIENEVMIIYERGLL